MKSKRSIIVATLIGLIGVSAAVLGGWSAEPKQSTWVYGVYSTNHAAARYRWESENSDYDDDEPMSLWRRMGVLGEEPEPEYTQDVDVITFLARKGWEPVSIDSHDRGVTYVFRHLR